MELHGVASITAKHRLRIHARGGLRRLEAPAMNNQILLPYAFYLGLAKRSHMRGRDVDCWYWLLLWVQT